MIRQDKPLALQQVDKARAQMHQLRCVQCQDTFGYSHYFVSEELWCASCTSAHPKPSVRCGMLGAGARMLRLALRQENYWLAYNLVQNALVWQRMAQVEEPLLPNLDLSKLEIKL